MSKAAKKQDWAVEKPKLDNAGKLRGIYFIDPEDEEHKETIEKKKNARKKLETPMEAATPCKMETRERFKDLLETVASGDTHPHKKTQVYLYCGSSRIYKEAFGMYSSEKSRGWPGGWGHQGRSSTGGGGPEGPEPACVRAPSCWGGTLMGRRANQRPAVVLSGRRGKYPQG